MSIPAKIFLYHRNNGWYYVGYLENGRKRWKSTRCRSKHEAVRAIANLPELIKPRPVDTLLSSFQKQFITHARGTLGVRTVEVYERAFKHFQALAGEVPLRSLTPKHFDNFKVKRLETVSPVSVNMELRALKAAFRTAVRWKLLDTSPFQDTRQVPVPEIFPPFFCKADFTSLLNAAPHGWLRDVIVFAALTGMRQGEIRNLKWHDVDLQRGLIRVQSSPSFRVKAGKVRVVPMNRAVSTLLQAKARRSSSDLVFTFRGRLIARNHLTHAFKVAVRAAKLDERLHFHSLRHTFASWLAQDGVSLFAIQRLLGHSSATVTQIYSHLQPDQMHETVNRISVVMN